MGYDPPQQPGGVAYRADYGDGGHERVKEQRQTESEQCTQHSTRPLPSPSMSSHSGTPSNPASSSSSSYVPRLISDGGSSSSPSSAPFQTPENMSNLDPFSSLSITAIPETDGLLPIVEDPTTSNGAPSTLATNPPSRPLPHNLQRLTSESLRPFDASMGDPRGSTASTPSVASSGRSERRDQLAPLPSQRPTPAERPSLTRSQSSHPRPSPPTPKFTPPARVPLPSPPAMGLSELMSGGSPLATPDNEYGYFSGVHSEPSTLSRSNSNSGSRRTPHYSPFRSYYGPPAGQVTPDQLRRSETQRGPQSGLEWMDRAEPPKASEASTQVRPPPHARAATTTAVSLTATATEVASSSVGSGSQGSRRGSVGSGSTGQGRSPRIQNTGGVLAPHGSFTTARAPKKKKERAPKMAPASDSQLYVGNMRKMDLSEKALAVQAERDALEQAARSGDQLAMYRLGWVAELPRGQRYNIGSIEDVWGPSSPASSETFRSSFSSRGSIASVSSTGQELSSSRQGTPTTDLFQDAAGLALRDTAGRNRSNSYFERPASRQSSAAQMSPRP